MKTTALLLSTLGLIFGPAPLAHADATQIADLRLPADAFAGSHTYFDPGFGPFPTRLVANAPVSIKTDFSGTTQLAGPSGPDKNDIALRTYHGALMITQLSRYNVDEKDQLRRIGAIQWRFDLSELSSYLTRQKLRLNSLELRLVEGDKDAIAGYGYDIYLSPAGLDAARQPVALDPKNSEENYRSLWLPAQERTAGDIFPYQFTADPESPNPGNQKVQIVRRGKMTNAPESVVINLTAQYQSGAREFTLILAGGTYGSNRNVKVVEGSGLFFTADPVR